MKTAMIFTLFLVSTLSLSAQAAMSKVEENALELPRRSVVQNVWLDVGPSFMGSIVSGKPVLVPIVGVDFEVSRQLALGPVFGGTYMSEKTNELFTGTGAAVWSSQTLFLTGLNFRWFALSSAQESGAYLRGMTGVAMVRDYKWSADSVYREGSSLGWIMLQTLTAGYQWKWINGLTLSADLGLALAFQIASPTYVGDASVSRSGGLSFAPMGGISIGFAP